MHVHKNLKCVLVLMDFLSSKRKLSLSLSFIARKTMMFIIKTQSDLVYIIRSSFPGHSHQSVSAEFLSLLDNGTEWTE